MLDCEFFDCASDDKSWFTTSFKNSQTAFTSESNSFDILENFDFYISRDRDKQQIGKVYDAAMSKK